MSKPFRFRHVNELVGGFVLLVVAVVIATVLLMGRAQGWLEHQFRLRIRFPPEGSYGVKTGATVSILDTPVGVVDEVLVNDDGSMEGVLRIRGRFVRFVRADSTAVLKKQFGIAGDSFVEITRGTCSPLPDGAVLPQPAVKDTELVQTLQNLLKQVQDAVVPVLEQVRRAVEEYTRLAADLRDPQGHLQQLLARLEEIAAGLQRGEGTAGRLLKDPATVNSVNAAITNVSAAIASARGSLAELEQILANVKAATTELPGVATQTRDTLREAEALIDGIQKHWLIRRYVGQPPDSGRIPAAEVAPAGGATP